MAIIVVGLVGGKLKFKINYKNNKNGKEFGVDNELQTKGLIEKIESLLNTNHKNKIEEIDKIYEIEEKLLKTKENLLINDVFDRFLLIEDDNKHESENINETPEVDK